jgi:hypothetical protein
MPNTDAAAHAAHDAYIDAINSNNLDNFLATITDDLVYLPPNSAAIVGKSEVGPWVQGYFEAFHTMGEDDDRVCRPRRSGLRVVHLPGYRHPAGWRRRDDRQRQRHQHLPSRR